LRLQQRHHAVGEVHHAEDVRGEQRAHCVDVEFADLGVVADPGVVDQHVDAAHRGDRFIDDARVIAVHSNVGANAMGARIAHGRCNVRVVAPGEHHVMSGRARLLNDGGADALAAAGDQKSTDLHFTIMGTVPRMTHSEVHL
jgi:hypothetical protein